MKHVPPSLAQRVIAAFGGLSATAKALGHPHVTTVDGWNRSGRIPYWRLREIRDAAANANVELPVDFPDAEAIQQRADAG